MKTKGNNSTQLNLSVYITTGGEWGVAFTQSREIQNPNHVKFNKMFTFHVQFCISYEESINFSRFTHKCIFTLSRDLLCIFTVHI
jgi:hypothetical protein